MLSQTQANTAALERDFSVLCDTLTALHDMARSLPAGVTVPLDKRAAFIDLETRVNRQFDRLSYVLATTEGVTLY